MRPTLQADARAAILSALQRAGLPGDVRIRAAALPSYKREQLTSCVVSVVSSGLASERIARKVVRLDPQTDVAIQRALPNATTPDGYVDLDPHSMQALEALFAAITAAV